MESVIKKADYYRLRAHRKSRSHYLAAKQDHQKHIALGVPVVITTTIVGTTIFATLSKEPIAALQIATGLLSIASALFAALQTFFKYSERAEKHRIAAANYASIFRKIDVFILRLTQTPEQDLSSSIEELEGIITQINQLEKDSPDVADRLYDKAVKEQIEDKEGV